MNVTTALQTDTQVCFHFVIGQKQVLGPLSKGYEINYGVRAKSACMTIQSPAKKTTFAFTICNSVFGKF